MQPSFAGFAGVGVEVVGSLDALPGFCGEAFKEVFPSNGVLLPNGTFDFWREGAELYFLAEAPLGDSASDAFL